MRLQHVCLCLSPGSVECDLYHKAVFQYFFRQTDALTLLEAVQI